MRKKVILWDQDNTIIDSTAMIKRNTRVMKALLHSRNVLSRQSPEMRALAKTNPDDYFMRQMQGLMAELFAVAHEQRVEAWHKPRVLPHMPFMKNHFADAARTSRRYLAKHYNDAASIPLPGVAETIQALKDQGATIVMLTDGVPEHAVKTALKAGFVDDLFDLFISRDHIHHHCDKSPMSIEPFKETQLSIPHYVVRHANGYPKHNPQLYDMVADLLSVEKSDMVLIDDHIDVLNKARLSGVDCLMAHYFSIGEEFMQTLAWMGLGRRSEYYANLHEFLLRMEQQPDDAANGFTVIRNPLEILTHVQGVPYGPVPDFHEGRCVRAYTP